MPHAVVPETHVYKEVIVVAISFDKYMKPHATINGKMKLR
jgi:hypothetical protein